MMTVVKAIRRSREIAPFMERRDRRDLVKRLLQVHIWNKSLPQLFGDGPNV